MRKAMVFGVLTLAGSLASPAFADEFSGFRMGLQFSQDKLKGTYSHSLVNPPSQTATDFDSDRGAVQLFGGWAMNKYLAAEVGYRQGTEFTKKDAYPEFVAALDPATGTGTDGSEFYRIHQDIQSLDASVVGSFWFNNSVSLFGRAGFVAWSGKVSYSFGDVNPPLTVPATPPYKLTGSKSDNGFAPLFGVGLQTQLDHALVRFEYTYADFGDIAFGTDQFAETFSSTDNKVSSVAFSIVWIL